MVDDVGGKKGLHALLVLEGQVAGQGVEPDSESGGLDGGVVLCQEGENDARQDIAAAAHRHAGIAVLGVDKGLSVRAIDGGVVPLEHDDEMVCRRESQRVIA